MILMGAAPINYDYNKFLTSITKNSTLVTYFKVEDSLAEICKYKLKIMFKIYTKMINLYTNK